MYFYKKWKLYNKFSFLFLVEGKKGSNKRILYYFINFF